MEARLTAFIYSSSKFKDACGLVFEAKAGRDGKMDGSEAVAAVDMLFELISKNLKDACIDVERPSNQKVMELFAAADIDKSRGLTLKEFESFYASVVTLSAVSAAKGALRAYGVGVGLGLASVILLKGTVRSVPLVGLLAAPFLALVPTIIVGPLLGAAGTYIYRKKGLEGLKDLVSSYFGKGGVKPKAS
jgi:hypothetical protein